MMFEAPRKIQTLMQAFPAFWAVAGGWAIYLFLGKETRSHKDIEIAILRKDQNLLQDFLPDWTFEYVTSGTFYPWEKERHLTSPIHETYATSPKGDLDVQLSPL